jgi:hypothetical protein
MIAPVSAPQVLDVLATPLQNAVAAFCSGAGSAPRALAMAETTLSAQKSPAANESSADLRMSGMERRFMEASDVNAMANAISGAAVR